MSLPEPHQTTICFGADAPSPGAGFSVQRVETSTIACDMEESGGTWRLVRRTPLGHVLLGPIMTLLIAPALAALGAVGAIDQFAAYMLAGMFALLGFVPAAFAAMSLNRDGWKRRRDVLVVEPADGRLTLLDEPIDPSAISRVERIGWRVYSKQDPNDASGNVKRHSVVVLRMGDASGGEEASSPPPIGPTDRYVQVIGVQARPNDRTAKHRFRVIRSAGIRLAREFGVPFAECDLGVHERTFASGFALAKRKS